VGGHQQAGLPSQEHLLLLLLQINKGKLIFFFLITGNLSGKTYG
jgi:hypothetical protein